MSGVSSTLRLVKRVLVANLVAWQEAQLVVLVAFFVASCSRFRRLSSLSLYNDDLQQGTKNLF